MRYLTFRKKFKARRYARRLARGKSVLRKPAFRQAKPYGMRENPFPRSLWTTGRYKELHTYGVGTYQSVTFYCYRLTDIWDPNYSGLGQSITNYAQLSSIYERYKVFACKANVQFFDPSADGIMCGAILCDNARRSQIMGLGYVTPQMIDIPNCYNNILNNSGTQRMNFKFYVKPWTFLARNKDAYKGDMYYDHYYGAVQADQATDVFLLLFVCNTEYDDSTPTIKHEIKLKYYFQSWSRIYTSVGTFYTGDTITQAPEVAVKPIKGNDK